MRILFPLALLLSLGMSACATAPDGEESAKKDEPSGVYCTKEYEMGSRKPVEVCRSN